MRDHNTSFIGRDKELAKLRGLLSKKVASLVVIKGRRRIGKTRLIEEFAHGKTFYQFVGLAPTDGVDSQIQRDEFSRLLTEQTGLPRVKTEDWSDLFTLLAERVKGGRVIILLDELTWMAHDDSTFLSKLKNAWELYFKKNPKLILILCSSISAWIEKNVMSSTAYFGRISQKITLQELPLKYCNILLESLGFQRSRYEKLMLLATTGGIPWYLELINPAYSASDNIFQLSFVPDGMFVEEHQRIFHDLFGTLNIVYEKITNYLADHTAEYSQISDGINYVSSGKLSEYLNNLIEAGYITRHFSWSLKTGRLSTISVYRLSDNYLRFYYKYIKPRLPLILQGHYEDSGIKTLPGWDTIMGLQFETLVLKNRTLLYQALNINPQEIVMDNIYYQRQTKRIPGCQIDYLIQMRFNTLFVFEIKFSSKEVGHSIIQEVREKITKLVIPKNYVILPILVHANGVTDKVIDADYFYSVIDFTGFLDVN